jgi:CheY-like chemotaxis protein
VAKILVADDNSNIQRMVGLALKDQGIDVVAVGNGEAAVRKISEVRPDLVLADVFMPVRNGYEVCQYVKEDASLAHIPVILLVGAFDPLDEQEAQRVGADGVLKKPFVPPDPLIAMVKAALLKAGVSLSPTGAEKTPPPAPRKGSDLLPPALPRVSPLAGVAFSGSQAFAPVVGEESFVDTPARQEPVRIDEAKHTMAFGNLLGPTASTEDSGFVASEEPETVHGSDWRSLDEPDDVPEEEDEDAKESAPSWRRDGGDGAFKEDDGAGPVKDWRDSPVLQTAGRKNAWEQAEEKGGFVSAAEVPTEMGAFATEVSALEAETLTASTQEAHGVEVACQEIAETGISVHASTSAEDAVVADLPAQTEHQPTAVADTAAAEATEPEQAGHSSVADAPAAEVCSEPASAAVAEESADTAAQSHDEPHAGVQQTEEKTTEAAPVNSWFSRSVSPWDAEAPKTDSLAASWDTAVVAATGGDASTVPEDSSGTPSNDVQSPPEETAAVVSDEPANEPASGNATAGTKMDMDALVAKVLARMSPEVLQAVTREILKPVVAAILEDELKNKH